MSLDMNNRANQAVAVLAVILLVVFAWDLGRKQALNSLLAGEATYPDSVSVTEYPPSDSGNAKTGKGSVGKDALALVGTGDESVHVADQPAGTEVKVSSLSLSETGWVGVRDGDGRVLGASRFDAGKFENVTVSLLRATVAGDSYQVLLYVDDGDREFDLHKDILISGPSGVAGTNFKAL